MKIFQTSLVVLSLLLAGAAAAATPKHVGHADASAASDYFALSSPSRTTGGGSSAIYANPRANSGGSYGAMLQGRNPAGGSIP